MIAVLTVFANHLWHWPSGGFVGVDIFFVISGFLITGNLLRMADATGNVSFAKFYWNRVRRIFPAATVVLLLTYAAACLIFQPFRAHQVGIDALAAFAFVANWHLAVQGTDYFSQGVAVSPLQHYWSLSIEEQFYFVWPALIFLIGVVVVRRSWTHSHRMVIAGVIMGAIVAASLTWATYESYTSPTWAYFSTFARIWELGVGALLAISASAFASIPRLGQTLLSWAGIALILASLLLIHDGSHGFPAPWAILPVVGASLVIAAGVNGSPRRVAFLTNPLSAYVGDISYSLYLVHWPVIVFAAALMDPSLYYSVVVIALSFGLAIASYHGVENPLRRIDSTKFRATFRDIRRFRYLPSKTTQLASVAATGLLAAGLVAYVLQPIPPAIAPPDLTTSELAVASDTTTAASLPPLASELRMAIVQALKAREWPPLDPPAESIIAKDIAADDVKYCGGPLSTAKCSWGNDDAQIRSVIIGDSIALAYLGPLHDIASDSAGKFQIHNEAQYFCYFIDSTISGDEKFQELVDACPARKKQALDYINETKPDVVFISHNYGARMLSETGKDITPKEWADSMRRYVDQFRGNVKKIVLISAPPADIQIADCLGKVTNVPANCVSKVTSTWRSFAQAEQALATDIGAIWVDSRPWFCASNRCPAFVDGVLTKADGVHMSPPYAKKITPVISEYLEAAGIY